MDQRMERDQLVSEDNKKPDGLEDVQPRPRSGPGSHIVSFRVSEDVYRALLTTCKTMQSSTPSEVAREMVHATLHSGASPSGLAMALALKRVHRILQKEISGLLRDFDRIVTTIEDPNPNE
jgi:hypothetical protein